MCVCVRAWVCMYVSDVSMRRTQWCVCVFQGREGWEVRVSSQGWRCTESSSQSGQVIGVLSVSWSSELLLSFSTLRNTSTPLLMRTTSSPLTHICITITDTLGVCCWARHSPSSICRLSRSTYYNYYTAIVRMDDYIIIIYYYWACIITLHIAVVYIYN